MRFTLRQLLGWVAAIAVLLLLIRFLGRAAKPHDGRAERNYVESIEYSPDGKMLAVYVMNGHESGFSDSGTWDAHHTLALFDPDTLARKQVVQHEFVKGREPLPFYTTRVPPRTFAFSMDSGSLYAARWKTNGLQQYDIGSGRWVGEQLADGIRPEPLTVSPGGNRISLIYPAPSIEMYDAPSGQVVFARRGGMQALSRGGETAAIVTQQGVEVWHIGAHKLLATFAENADVLKRARAGSWFPISTTVRCVALAPNGGAVAIASEEGLRICDIATGSQRVLPNKQFEVPSEPEYKIRPRFIASSSRGLVYSPDGKCLVVWGIFGMKFIDVANDYALMRSVPWSNFLCLTFSPDGKTYATGDSDGKLAIWDLATGKELRSVVLDGSMVGTN